jgi:serine/threonine protein phosphatase 1
MRPDNPNVESQYLKMTGRTIAVGDIHGCAAALKGLLEKIAPTPQDTIITLGDYVDRGPDTRGVIDALLELGKQCNLVALMGNHEEMMLEVVRDKQAPYRWLQFGGVETLDSYGFVGNMSVIPESHFDFFRSMKDYYETEDHIFTHANYNPQLPLEKQTKHALRWQKLTDFTPAAHHSGKRAIVGHTHDRGGEIFDVGHLICIDTFCYGGGWLTALDVHSGKLWQVDPSGRSRG